MTDTEKSTLCARIDELCAEVERLRNQLHDQQDTAEHNFVRNAREYKRVCDENAKLRELAARMARALGVGRWCSADCGREFGCDWEHCPIEVALRELGVDE